MDFTIFVTVMSGVLTYVLGQVVVKLVIEPVQEFKKTIGKVAHALVMRANVTSNPGVGTSDVLDSTSEELRTLSSDLHTHLRLIPYFSLSAKIFGLPSQQEVLQASSSLIGLSNGVHTVRENTYGMNANGVKKIRDSLRIYHWE